jgi:hypothetical protein
VLEELSEVLVLGVAAAAGMYAREYQCVAAVAAAGQRKCHGNWTHQQQQRGRLRRQQQQQQCSMPY